MAEEKITLPGTYNDVEATLVDGKGTKNIYLESLPYLPDFLQNKPVMKDAAKLLDALLTTTDDDTLKEINQAYCDTIYKISAYNQLSFAAKKELIKEKGFGYILDLLLYIYEEKYYQLSIKEQKKTTLEEYLEKYAAQSLTNLVSLFNLLYVLKGKTVGLELALQLVSCPDFLYLTWDTIANYKGEWDGDFDTLPMPGGDIEVEKGDAYQLETTCAIFNGVAWHKCSSYAEYLTERQRFTAELIIWGLPSTQLQARIVEFVRYYMLPYIDVTIEYTDTFDPVYCFPSGDSQSAQTYVFSNYYDDNGDFIYRDLSLSVSDVHTYTSSKLQLPITLGQPIFAQLAFQGTVDLARSYVRHDGIDHYLYGVTKTWSEGITGDARDSLVLSDDSTITFNNDYIQAPLNQGTVVVDIVTGDQNNSYYDKTGNFIRDTIITYPVFLEDEYQYDAAEVYAGRVTKVTPTNPSGILSFTTDIPTVRTDVGEEDTVVLKFTDAFVEDYSGIGDLGILGANSYFIYNNMLYVNTDGDYAHVGQEMGWSDIGASHAVSETYYTPGILNGQLYWVKDSEYELIERDEDSLDNYTTNITIVDKESDTTYTRPDGEIVDYSYWIDIEKDKWTAITGYVNEYYTAYGICDGYLYSIYFPTVQEDTGVSTLKPIYSLLDNEEGWEFITGVSYESLYEAYGIKNGVMYRISTSTGIHALSIGGEEITGWNPNINCVSRYHHSNEDYITYGVCNGKLYSIKADTTSLLDASGEWTAVCGFYNNNSPRTFGYGIKDGALYELQGLDVVLKDDTRTWTCISGCTTTTNTFALGIADGYMFEINAKTLKQLYDTDGWTYVIGRYTTSTANSANCYGYGVRNNRMYILHRDELIHIHGMWKLNGEGAEINLNDYNITDLVANTSEGIVEGIDNVKAMAPTDDEEMSDYDIYIDYKTIGFEDNTRYIVKTENTSRFYIYVHPEECRENMYETNCKDCFDETTGLFDNFVSTPLVNHENQKINGKGEAYEFNPSYLELPEYTFENVIIHFGCVITSELLPIVIDENETTCIYYGYCEDLDKYGVFVKTTTGYNLIDEVELNYNTDLYVKYQTSGDSVYDVYYSTDNENYELVVASDTAGTSIYSPKYLGGNGNIFGDSIIYLADSSYTVNNETQMMFINNQYFVVDTMNQTVKERIDTGDNQESQKIIEIQDMEGNKIIELSMDNMYVARTHETSNTELELKDYFCWNYLNFGEHEGTTTSTLVYSGGYTLDPEKAQDVGNIKEISEYNIDGYVHDFDTDDYIKVDFNETLVITTEDEVEYQTLFTTEEDSAYTNKYLLTSENELSHSRGTAHAVPSGLVYEADTDEPKIVTHDLVYNAEAFEIDPDKIQEYESFDFDSYTALLSGFASIGVIGSIIPLDLTLVNTETNDDKETTYYEVEPILVFNTSDMENENQKIAQFDHTGIHITDGSDEGIVVNSNTEYYLKMGIERESRGIQNITLHETTSEEEKDKFQFLDGTVWNFSAVNYVVTQKVVGKYGLAVTFNLSEDISKDQGLIGIPNGMSVAIKDHKLVLCNANGEVIEETDEDIQDDDTITLIFKLYADASQPLVDHAYVYLEYPDDSDFEEDEEDDDDDDDDDDYEAEEGERLFETPIDIQDEMWIGYANAGSGMLPFNGSVDLTQSYTIENKSGTILNRFYDLVQTTTFYLSSDGGQTYNSVMTIVTNYPVSTITFGYKFSGNLDMYKSKLLKDYTLGWVEDGVYIDTKIKEKLAEVDPNYDPETDENTYYITEYGVHLEDEPQRWDTIITTYTTVDHAYYMQPNTTYYLKTDVELDENGVCILEQQGNPTWNSGIVSGFSEEDYFSIDFTDEQYLVLDCTINDTNDQYLCGYIDDNTQHICVKDGKWQYFDDEAYYEICNAKIGQYYFKLPILNGKIEYSQDGETWIETDIETQFNGYETFNIGKAYCGIFNGTINLNTSYTISDTTNYLFTLYKRVTPYISEDGENWYSLVLTPLLTLENMINFGQGFDGQLDIIESNLIIESETYWTTNKVKIYALEDHEEDGIKADELVKEVIRDSWYYEDGYYMEDEKIKIDPMSIKLQVTGRPIVGDTIVLTYESWYLFRKINTIYDFNVIYNDSYVDIMYYQLGTAIEYDQWGYPHEVEAPEYEYIIYRMPLAEYLIAFGYNFFGSLVAKESTRGEETFCDYFDYYTYDITYRKYDEEEWTDWSSFTVEISYDVYQRTGYTLGGVCYVEQSYYVNGNLKLPFLAYYDNTYIRIVGGPTMSTTGITSDFTEDDYLEVIKESIVEGDYVTIFVTLSENTLWDQGIALGVYVKDSYLMIDDEPVQKVKAGDTIVLQYYIGDYCAYLNVTLYNAATFTPGKSPAYTLTLIPYNKDLGDTEVNYYVTSNEQAAKLKVYYRLGDDRYDHFVVPDLTWYETPIEKIDSIDYFGSTLTNVYVAKIQLGYDFDYRGNATNTNPDGLEFTDRELVEYKIVSTDGLVTTNKTFLYKDKIEKERTTF